MTQSDIDFLLSHKSIFDPRDQQKQKNATDREWVQKIISQCKSSEVCTWNIQDIVAIYVWNPGNLEAKELIEQWIQHFNEE
tara:strand:+ start:6929 stop:7171 length:243 start_codon:yes stop_codon:yes gene_type:complete